MIDRHILPSGPCLLSETVLASFLVSTQTRGGKVLSQLTQEMEDVPMFRRSPWRLGGAQGRNPVSLTPD